MSPVAPCIVSAAQSAQRKWGIPASVTLAQYGLESGWGHAIPFGSNNPFGIKAVADQPFVECATTEYIDGIAHSVRQRFRKFLSIGDAFDEHGRLLAESRYYEKARSALPDPMAFADALTGVYATDPGYGAKLRKVMTDCRLGQFDDLHTLDATQGAAGDGRAVSAVVMAPPADPSPSVVLRPVSVDKKSWLASLLDTIKEHLP